METTIYSSVFFICHVRAVHALFPIYKPLIQHFSAMSKNHVPLLRPTTFAKEFWELSYLYPFTYMCVYAKFYNDVHTCDERGIVTSQHLQLILMSHVSG